MKNRTMILVNVRAKGIAHGNVIAFGSLAHALVGIEGI